MRHRLVLVVLLTFTATAATSTASAATKLETRTETTERKTVFRGIGCTATTTRTAPIPEGAFDVDVLAPRQRTELISSINDDPTATVQSVAVADGTVTWTAVGSGQACDPGYSEIPWETENVRLRVQYRIRRRVLTRGTVIARADRTCRSAGRKLERIERRMARLNDTDIDGLVRAMRDLAMTLRGVHRRLDRLDEPSERRRSYEGFLRAVDRLQDRADSVADAAREYDIGAMEFHAGKITSTVALAGRHAKRYGFKYCGRGGGVI